MNLERTHSGTGRRNTQGRESVSQGIPRKRVTCLRDTHRRKVGEANDELRSGPLELA